MIPPFKPSLQTSLIQLFFFSLRVEYAEGVNCEDAKGDKELYELVPLEMVFRYVSQSWDWNQ
jgi:hypothetical protein